MYTFRHSLKVVILMALLLVGALIRESVTAQNCQSASDIASELKNRAPAADGKIHVTYSFNDPNISQASKNAILKALAEYDKAENGGNSDSAITTSDAAFSVLRLWQDINHNGISEPSELKTLLQLGLTTLDLDYRQSKKTDEYGNLFLYRSKVKDVNGAQLGRWAWDVFLLPVR